jgi:hypothetical protein
MAEPGSAHGHLRTSHADREHIIGVLKAAYVYGLVTKGEFDDRVSRTFVSRTYAELALVTADFPPGLPSLPREPAEPGESAAAAVRPGDHAVMAAAIVTFVVLATGMVMPEPTSGLLFLLAAVIAGASLLLLRRQLPAGPRDSDPGGQPPRGGQAPQRATGAGPTAGLHAGC